MAHSKDMAMARGRGSEASPAVRTLASSYSPPTVLSMVHLLKMELWPA